MASSDVRRYALFYLGYYGPLGAYAPYIGRWIVSQDHGGYVVGAMLALWYGGTPGAGPHSPRAQPPPCWRWRCT